jgi:hypothetical protein
MQQGAESPVEEPDLHGEPANRRQQAAKLALF